MVGKPVVEERPSKHHELPAEEGAMNETHRLLVYRQLSQSPSRHSAIHTQRSVTVAHGNRRAEAVELARQRRARALNSAELREEIWESATCYS